MSAISDIEKDVRSRDFGGVSCGAQEHRLVRVASKDLAFTTRQLVSERLFSVLTNKRPGRQPQGASRSDKWNLS